MVVQILVFFYEIEFVVSLFELSQMQFYLDKDIQEILNFYILFMKFVEIYFVYYVVLLLIVDMLQIILLDLVLSIFLRVLYVNYKSINYLGYKYFNDMIKLLDVIVVFLYLYNSLFGVFLRKKYCRYVLFLLKLDEVCSQNYKNYFIYKEFIEICYFFIEDIKEIVRFLDVIGVVEDDEVVGIKLFVNLS